LGTIKSDDEIARYDLNGIPLVDLPDETPVYQAVAGMLKTIL
jgi:CO dehydrogenase nickel-insertion accessory protein CooC1